MVKGCVDSVVLSYFPSLRGKGETIPSPPPFKDGVSAERYIERMDEAGIERSILIASQSGGHYWSGRGFIPPWKVPVEKVKEIIDSYPDRFHGLAGVDPTKGNEGLREIEYAVEELGFVGAHVYPHWWKLPPNHKKYYPIYAKCVELDISIEMQVGFASQSYLPSVARPILLDEVAADFPDLRIIGLHTGWPWVDEMIAMMMKHENVYTTTSGHYPLTDWENAAYEEYAWPALDPKLVNFINKGRGGTDIINGGRKSWRGADKVLMGTDFPIWDCRIFVEEMKGIMNEEAFWKVCRDNAVKVFKL
jgi:hypothetical protein